MWGGKSRKHPQKQYARYIDQHLFFWGGNGGPLQIRRFGIYCVSKCAMFHAICNMLHACQLVFRICSAVVGRVFAGGSRPLYWPVEECEASSSLTQLWKNRGNYLLGRLELGHYRRQNLNSIRYHGRFLSQSSTPQIVIDRLDISMKQRDEVSGGIEAPMTLEPCFALTSNDSI